VLGEGLGASVGVGDGVGDGVGIGVGEGNGLGDSKGNGLGTGDGNVAVDLTEVMIIEVRLTTVVAITMKIGIRTGISYILCLKNSTWRRRFLASSLVLYGPPKLRLVFSEKT
jgi:hypothetical protein